MNFSNLIQCNQKDSRVDRLPLFDSNTASAEIHSCLLLGGEMILQTYIIFSLNFLVKLDGPRIIKLLGMTSGERKGLRTFDSGAYLNQKYLGVP